MQRQVDHQTLNQACLIARQTLASRRRNNRHASLVRNQWTTKILSFGYWARLGMFPSAMIALAFSLIAYYVELLSVDQAAFFLIGSWSVHFIVVLTDLSNRLILNNEDPR